MEKMTREDLYQEVAETLAHLFEADPESIKPEARLAEDTNSIQSTRLI